MSDVTVKDADGNVYQTVEIGNQVWTVENLRTTKFDDGSAIPLVTDTAAWKGNTTPAYCWYDNDTIYKTKYGALYNWYAVDNKKLAPKGWHVPSDAEWNTLQNYLIANGYNWDGTTTGNKLAKSLAAKTTDWEPDRTPGTVGNDLSKNNRSGFSALPGGSRNNVGDFDTVGYLGLWWSATEYDTSDAFTRYFGNEYDDLYRIHDFKNCGLSVRLVRDSN
jgi:uncharacterized protein (TIGR02145 family)